ncbi:LysR substrate-binding domain-containing protein [Vulcanococcus limneticus]|uniref:LysR substrate-binding domain-containing protein n=1 Tax=Vulcanococcus limneticus TaxID=2170428 RepID=UPI00398BC76A
MLSVDKLAALDLSQWLRSGQKAGQRLHINQATVSRRVQHALRVFELGLLKREQEWELQGSEQSLALLALERHVHQTARWGGHAPLRIEGTYWSGPLLLTPAPEGWLGGRHDTVGVQRPQQWLRDRVIDAWLTGGPDWPEADDPELCTLQLCTMPVHLVVAPEHPLLLQLERGEPLSWDDVAAFPSLALPPGTYPKVEASLRALGLWSSPTRMTRYRRERWEGKGEQDLLVAYATVLSEQVAGRLVRLPMQLPISSGEALVVRREWTDHPRTLALADLLRQRLEPWAAAHGELVMTPPPSGP